MRAAGNGARRHRFSRHVRSNHGHRGVAEIDVGVARWGEDPAHIFNALANYLRLDDEDAAPTARFARAAREGEAAVDELAGRLGRGLRARMVRFCLGRVRQIGGLRERPKFVLALLFARLRAHLLRVGAELVERGRLSAADDIFMVDLRRPAPGCAARTCGRWCASGGSSTRRSVDADTSPGSCCRTVPNRRRRRWRRPTARAPTPTAGRS